MLINAVAPFAGAWIEISNRNEVHQAWFASLPSREHVRKRIVTEKMSKKMGERHMDYFAHIDGKRKQKCFGAFGGGLQDLLECLPENLESMNGDIASGMLHDIGKYSLRFQRRLQKGDVQVDHSTAGAQLCAAKGGYYSFLNYCIAGHHAGLPDCGSNTDNGGESTLSGRLKKKIEDYQAYQSEIEVPLLHSAPIDPKAVPNPYFSLSFFYANDLFLSGRRRFSGYGSFYEAGKDRTRSRHENRRTVQKVR